jgi:hypothetical protein
MKITIDRHTAIKDIQHQFQKTFPFLKIEFAARPHGFMGTVQGNHWYDPNALVSNIPGFSGEGYIDLQSWSRTGDVEDAFKTKLGLYPQIFRRLGYKWVETAGTDLLSLDEQNSIGRESLVKRSGNLWLEKEYIL